MSVQEWEHLNLSIDGLLWELNSTAWTELENANYCLEEEDKAYHMNNVDKCSLGVNLCQRYIYGILNIEEFCNAMIDAGLKGFLNKISSHLPEDILNMFGLNETSDYESDGEVR
ncbi:uncharacterized protein LOC111692239 [Anoplophora glabripennis]|uniref:uncharacterized protein LOC111692239 n=1 Tax=Anoplophora glabripennis TaxID=217634 RepID=UPI000C76FF97|nr:uncharacterized protein LOC111692239 [Anoplophora glabripennis]